MASEKWGDGASVFGDKPAHVVETFLWLPTCTVDLVNYPE